MQWTNQLLHCCSKKCPSLGLVQVRYNPMCYRTQWLFIWQQVNHGALVLNETEDRTCDCTFIILNGYSMMIAYGLSNLFDHKCTQTLQWQKKDQNHCRLTKTFLWNLQYDILDNKLWSETIFTHLQKQNQEFCIIISMLGCCIWTVEPSLIINPLISDMKYTDK